MNCAISRNGIIANVFWALVFLYFLTLSAEKLYFEVYLFKPKLNHLIAITLLSVLFFSQKHLRLSKRFAISFIALFVSITISSLFSVNFARSLGYSLVSVFMFICFFLIPFNLMTKFNHVKILKIYFSSFLIIGSYAFLQFFLSFFGIIDPNVYQFAGGSIARGQAFSYEPSFYALYGIPFVAFYNTKTLLSHSRNFTSPISKVFKRKFIKFFGLTFVNLLLISSTSTSVFFSYIFYIILLIYCTRLKIIQHYIKNTTFKILKIGIFFSSFFIFFAIAFYQLFVDTFFKFFVFGFSSHWSFADRWETIRNSWQVFCEFPLFGVGLGSVGPYLYQKLNFYESAPIYNPTIEIVELFDPQNVFTEVLSSLGIFGLIVILTFVYNVASFFWRSFSDKRLCNEERMTIFSLFISVIVMMACLQINQGLFRSYIWVHLGICIGYVQKTMHELRYTPSGSKAP